MKLFREGNLIEGNIQTGNVLVVELQANDVVDLADPGVGYRMDRFSSFPHQWYKGGFGWSSDDKVHIRLKDGTDEPDKLATLMVDPGGDLNFTIYNGDQLRQSHGDDSFPAEEPFLIADPSEKLDRLGIDTVRFFGFMAIAQEISEPRWLPRAIAEDSAGSRWLPLSPNGSL